DAGPDRQPAGDERRVGLRLQSDRAARAVAADGLASPEEAARGRSRRARAAGQVGLLLAEPRRRQNAVGRRRPERSVLLMATMTAADDLREQVRRRYAE